MRHNTFSDQFGRGWDNTKMVVRYAEKTSYGIIFQDWYKSPLSSYRIQWSDGYVLIKWDEESPTSVAIDIFETKSEAVAEMCRLMEEDRIVAAVADKLTQTNQ